MKNLNIVFILLLLIVSSGLLKAAYSGFDAIDEDEEPIAYDQNIKLPIKTKVVNKDFNLKILWINTGANPAVLNTSGSIDINVYLGYIENGSIQKLSGTQKYIKFNNDGQVLIGPFSYNKAVREAIVVFEYCRFNKIIYPLASCTNNVNYHLELAASRDKFAIRPDKFDVNISNGAVFIAEKDVSLSFQALDGNTTLPKPSPDYIETEGSSFEVDLNVSGDCAISDLTITPSVSFQDGEHNDSFVFNDIGNVNMSIYEININETITDQSLRKEFAKIDIDDTPTNTRLIEQKDINFTILPDHFSIEGNFTDHHISTDQNFTYLSDFAKNAARNAKAMASEYNLTIMAKKFDDDNASNYTSGCFAKDLNITIVYDTLNADGTSIDLSTTDLSKVQYYEKNIDGDENNDTYHDVNIGTDINYSFSPAIFNEDINGTALVQINVNMDRHYYTAINPFIFTLSNISLEDNDSVTGTSIIDQNVTYFSARAKSSQYFYDDVTASSKTTSISVVVYCNLGLAECSLYGLDSQTDEYTWYLSRDHNTSNIFDDGDITLIASAGGGVPSNIVTIINGGINNTVSVSNTSGTTPHLVNITFGDNTGSAGTNNWLIYNEDNDSEPNPFYKVKFIGISDWAGHGDTGHVVNSDSSIKKNRRLGW